MKKILLALIIFLSSCGVTNYWSDDVYYSLPAQRENGYIDLHDRYLRMKSRDTRWSQFDDDFWYWNSPRQNVILPYSIYDPYFGYNRFRNPFVPQIGWIPPYTTFWYNPYSNLWRYNTIYNYNPYVLSNPKPVIMPRQQPQPRTFNLSTYGSSRTSNTYIQPNSAPVRVFNNTTTTNSRTSVNIPQTRTNSIPAQASPRPSTNAPVRKF